MKEVLNIIPIPIKQSVVDMGHSLIELGIVKKSKKYKEVYTSNFCILKLKQIPISTEEDAYCLS